jgi:hypothetical protein
MVRRVFGMGWCEPSRLDRLPGRWKQSALEDRGGGQIGIARPMIEVFGSTEIAAVNAVG